MCVIMANTMPPRIETSKPWERQHFQEQMNKHAHHDGKSNASKNKPKTNVTMVEVAPLRTNK